MESGMDRDPLLVEREKTHGRFTKNAAISQAIKDSYRAAAYTCINVVHQEALDMIASKIARILTGSAYHKDHWLDIAGYAMLGAEACDD